MFDGCETYGLVLVMAPAVHQLLPAERLQSAPEYIGGLLAATMVGWAVGGVSAGVIADYVGRRRTLMLSILCYAVFAGLSAIAWDYGRSFSFVFLRGLGWGPSGDQALRSLPSLGHRHHVGALAVCFTLLMEWVCSWPRAFGCCSIRLGHLRGS